MECWEGGYIPTPNGVFPLEDVFVIDPFANGVDLEDPDTDDVWSLRKNNYGSIILILAIVEAHLVILSSKKQFHYMTAML